MKLPAQCAQVKRLSLHCLSLEDKDMGALVRLLRSVPRVREGLAVCLDLSQVDFVKVGLDPRHWEVLASGLADSGSRVTRLHMVEVTTTVNLNPYCLTLNIYCLTLDQYCNNV